MLTVTVQDKYATALSTLGNLQTAVDQAVQRYTIEQIVDKVAQLRHKAVGYETKYGMTYPAFAERTALDEGFVQTVEATISPLWEVDLVDWEFCVKGIEDWTHTLQTLLLT